MRWSFKIGTIAGIRVELHVTFLIFLGWIALSSGLATGRGSEALSAVFDVLLIFGCVVLHELGHATAARRYGIATRDIILLPIGGVARLTRMPDKPSEELVVALAGPAVNVVIVSLLLLCGIRYVDPTTPRDIGVLQMLLLVNTVMILFNMIPAFPMDGGRVLRALLAMRLSYARATRIASAIGQAFALLFGVMGLFVWHNVMLAFVAMFVFLAAAEERALVETRTSLGGLPVRAVMVTDFRALDAREPLQRAVDYLMAGSQQDFPVLDGGVPVGVLTRADLVRALQTHGAEVPVGVVVRRSADAIEAGEPLDAAMQRMRERGHSALPVLQQGMMIGMITLENVGELLLVRDALQRHSRA
jgi:Zn-dependent protease/predicted transcriptional regulator